MMAIRADVLSSTAATSQQKHNREEPESEVVIYMTEVLSISTVETSLPMAVICSVLVEMETAILQNFMALVLVVAEIIMQAPYISMEAL